MVQERVTREEFYPIVGKPTETLKALVPTFGERLMDGIREALNTPGVTSAILRLIHEGNNPQTLEVLLRKQGEDSQGEDSQIEVEIRGNMEGIPVLPRGLPIIANFSGSFYRRMRPEDEKYIAKEGDILGPDDPIGLASAGKSRYWLWRLPPATFPNGGKITEFVHPDGEEVEPGVTIICYVEKV